MARKQNQKALYEAIRQGQAKIAEGLKTGQMRSDRKRLAKITPQSQPYSAAQAPVEEEPSMEEEDYGDTGSSVSSKPMVIGLIAAAQLFVLIVGIWFGAYLFKDKNKEAIKEEPVNPPALAENPVTPAPKTSLPVLKEQPGPVAAPVREKPVTLPPVQTEKKTEPVPPATESRSTGNNVIVIQGIQAGRKDELLPLKDFFAKKGIETEIMIRNGYGLLVTKTGFAVNPESKGTPGFELMQRIKDLGLLYPQETGDTKFGLKPFQDSYGLLK
jgi:hypothetical protein